MALLYVWSGAAGSGSGADWTNAKTTLTAAFTTEVAGDTLYVAHDHAESTAGAVTLTSSGTVSNPTKVVCVNRAGSVPPVSADRRTTAQTSTTGGGANNITITGVTHYDGIIFNGSSSVLLNTTNNNWLRFDNCSLRVGSGGAKQIWTAGGGTVSGAYLELNNTTMSFTTATDFVNFSCTTRWRNTPSALIGAAVPSNLFVPWGTRGGLLECIGVDFSALGSGKTLVRTDTSAQSAICKFVDCKLDAAANKAGVSGVAAPATHGSMEIDFIRSGAAGVNYAVYSSRTAGLLIEETTIVRTGGATDGTTAIAWKIVTTANCNYSMPFECPPIAIWVDTTGSAVTATVEGIWGGGAVPNDDDVWLEVEYLGSSSSPQGSFVNDGKVDLLTTAAGQTSSSETWGGSTTKFKLAVTFTPQQRGWIYARVKVGKLSSTFYIDPLVTLT